MSDTKDLVRQQIELFNKGKIDELVAEWADDAELITPMTPAPLKGRDAIVQYWKQLRESFPDAKVTIHRMVSDGGTTVTEYTFTGTNTGPLILASGEKLPSTGKRIEGRAVDIGTMKDGKVTSLHQYFDTMAAFAQLGLVPAPAQASR